MADIELRSVRSSKSTLGPPSSSSESNTVEGSNTASLPSDRRGDHDIESNNDHVGTAKTYNVGADALPAESAQWVTGNRLRTLGAACLLANLMMAIDGSILGRQPARLGTPDPWTSQD